MKLLQIALSLLLVLFPIACATFDTTQDAVSNTRYGMELHEAQKAVDAEGKIVLRWAEKGSNYFVTIYKIKKTRGLYCMIFKDDIFTVFVEKSDFDDAFGKHTVPAVGKLPFEDGFEPLYSELVAQKVKSPHVEVNEFLHYGDVFANVVGVILFHQLIISGYMLPREKSYYTLVNEYKAAKSFDKISIGTSKGTLIKLLGQPESSHKSIGSDYEILSYRYGIQIGLRDGKIEWILEDTSGLHSQLGGCASRRYAVTMPLKTQLREYSILEIKDFENYVNGSEAETVAKEIPGLLLDAITKHNELHPDRRLFSEVTRSTSKSDGVLVVKGTVLRYEKRSNPIPWMSRNFLHPIWHVRGTSTIKCEFIDKSTGEHELEAKFEGIIFQSPYTLLHRAYPRGEKEIVDCIKDNY